MGGHWGGKGDRRVMGRWDDTYMFIYTTFYLLSSVPLNSVPLNSTPISRRAMSTSCMRHVILSILKPMLSEGSHVSGSKSCRCTKNIYEECEECRKATENVPDSTESILRKTFSPDGDPCSVKLIRLLSSNSTYFSCRGCDDEHTLYGPKRAKCSPTKSY